MIGHRTLTRVSPAIGMKRLHKNPKAIQRSCTKHGAYTGPYCPECYQKAIGLDEPSIKDEKSESD